MKSVKSVGTCNYYKSPNAGLLVLRIGVGVVFILAAIGKFTAMPMTTFMFAQMGLGAFWVWAVAIGEAVGGLALLLGVFTWLASIVLGIIMAVAVFITLKMGAGMMGALAPLSLLLVSVNLFLSGPGRYSLENRCNCGKCLMCKMSGKGKNGKGVCVCSAGLDRCNCDENCADCDCGKK